MSLSMQGSGRECWENSPHTDVRDRCSREQHPTTRSVERDAERSSDRREPRPVDHDEGMIDSEAGPLADSEFGHLDTTGWYPHYTECVHYFVEIGQHNPTVQSLAAFINIRLPAQRPEAPTTNMSPVNAQSAPFISLRPYVRRLIITAQDSPSTMQAFFGTDWPAGVGCIHKQERANYLFTAKSSGWAKTKAAYDLLPDEQAPFLRPLRDPSEEEIRTAEARWSEWLAMEDWMVGARSPW
ncbi:uncharacterized protein N7482_009512 [Penicillium canariense]|uniref:Uncharacterized protein n=1 Tax=Penicillium canariense TaxID=189055 RepID=A0A9W9HQK2_9EURO|nr:uncharacterized protein N7482_009512 [Penicillium canariense]KAJ5153034.1 hypothetical protein N7482_009512 [Penicillium canariense]